jgi:5'-3' exonuclease
MARTRNDLYVRLEQFIFNILETTNPTKGVVIRADGAAPFAKLILQRSRRLDMSRKEIDTETTSLNFTPGTEFMMSLHDKLDQLIKRIKIVYNVKVDVVITEPDEAEIKVKRKVCEIMNEEPNSTHCVVSNDADVIVLMMNVKEIHNVYIMHKNGKNIELINLGVMLNMHTQRYGCSDNPGEDFTILNILLGNDYIPKLNFITYEKLWDAYKLTLKHSPLGVNATNISISKTFMTDLMLEIIDATPSHLIKKFKFGKSTMKHYNAYIEGLIWCSSLYKTGRCDRYDYVYDFDETPHPMGLLIALEIRKNFNNDLNKSKPICNKLYSILLIPRGAKDIIDSNYHDLLNDKRLDMLYEQENCDTCHEYHIKLGELHKQYKEDEDLKTKKKLTQSQKQFTAHKKKHLPISMDDINIIKAAYNEYTASIED